jgi:transcriptional regulator with XRE-family HTH domain
MEEIVTRIERWRQKSGMTPAELAKALDMNRSSVVHMLNGRNKPSLQFVLNIAQYDQALDLRELLTGTRSKTESSDALSLEVNEVAPSPLQPSETLRTKEVAGEVVKERLIVLKIDGTFDSFTKEE